MRPARGVRVPEASKEPRDFQAMQLLLNAAVLAFPLILPAAILICLRIWPMRAAGQRRAMAAAWAFYGLSLVAFAAHAAGIEGVNPVQEFTLAFWGGLRRRAAGAPRAGACRRSRSSRSSSTGARSCSSSRRGGAGRPAGTRAAGRRSDASLRGRRPWGAFAGSESGRAPDDKKGVVLSDTPFITSLWPAAFLRILALSSASASLKRIPRGLPPATLFSLGTLGNESTT